MAVEVGYLRGTFANVFLSRWPGETLVSIDPWQPIGDNRYDRRTDRDFALHRLANHGDRIDLQPEVDSEELAERILARYRKPEFVFFDGDHTNEGAAKSIGVWSPRLAEIAIAAGKTSPDPGAPGSAIDGPRPGAGPDPLTQSGPLWPLPGATTSRRTPPSRFPVEPVLWPRNLLQDAPLGGRLSLLPYAASSVDPPKIDYNGETSGGPSAIATPRPSGPSAAAHFAFL